MMIVKEWRIVNSGNPFVAPELQKFYLQGKVYGSEKFENGDLITTTSIKDVRDCGDYKIITTKNSEYAVYKDDVDKEYENRYNNAFERLSFRMEEQMGKTDELCPYCGQEVEINAKCISKCPNCDKWICPCSMCNMDAVDCEGCELDKQTKIKNGE